MTAIGKYPLGRETEGCLITSTIFSLLFSSFSYPNIPLTILKILEYFRVTCEFLKFTRCLQCSSGKFLEQMDDNSKMIIEVSVKAEQCPGPGYWNHGW